LTSASKSFSTCSRFRAGKNRWPGDFGRSEAALEGPQLPLTMSLP
jgi:hypothetical protein